MAESSNDYKIIHIENTFKKVGILNKYIQPTILDEKDVNLDALDYLASITDDIRNNSEITEEERKTRLDALYQKVLDTIPPQVKKKAEKLYDKYMSKTKEPYYFVAKDKAQDPTSLDFDNAPSFNQESIDVDDLLDDDYDYEMPITDEDDFLGPKAPNTFDPSNVGHSRR